MNKKELLMLDHCTEKEAERYLKNKQCLFFTTEEFIEYVKDLCIELPENEVLEDYKCASFGELKEKVKNGSLYTECCHAVYDGEKIIIIEYWL